MKQDLEQHLPIQKLSHFFLPIERKFETQVNAHSDYEFVVFACFVESE